LAQRACPAAAETSRSRKAQVANTENTRRRDDNILILLANEAGPAKSDDVAGSMAHAICSVNSRNSTVNHES
jgi:hypothetical protein